MHARFLGLTAFATLRQLDWFARFCKTHSPYICTLDCAAPPHFPEKLTFLVKEGTPSDTPSLWPTRPTTPNGILDPVSRFSQNTRTNRQKGDGIRTVRTGKIPQKQFPRNIPVTSPQLVANFFVTCQRHDGQARHARQVGDMLATCQTILACR